MLHWKTFGLAVLAVVCLLGETAGSAQAQCTPIPNFNCATEWSGGQIINLGGATTVSIAYNINNAGQAVGQGDGGNAVVWSGGNAVNLGPGIPYGINDKGQVVGLSPLGPTEWSGGKVIGLGSLPGSIVSQPFAINDAGQVAGISEGAINHATEWSGGSVINLGGLPGYTSSGATSINAAGQIVGYSIVTASSMRLNGATAPSSIWEVCWAPHPAMQ